MLVIEVQIEVLAIGRIKRTATPEVGDGSGFIELCIPEHTCAVAAREGACCHKTDGVARIQVDVGAHSEGLPRVEVGASAVLIEDKNT